MDFIKKHRKLLISVGALCALYFSFPLLRNLIVRAADKYVEFQDLYYVHHHGAECIASAFPIDDGHKLKACEGQDLGDGVFRVIIYDSSDQMMLPSENRSDLWNYVYLSHYYGAHDYKDSEVKKILGHFYEKVWSVDNGADIGLNDFISRYNCSFGALVFTCEHFDAKGKK